MSPNAPESRRGSYFTHILRELGLLTVFQSSSDVKLLIAQRFVRLFAYGGSTLILASYLSALGISDDRIGLFMTLTLVGDVVISFFLTLFADRMGRKAVLILGSGLMAGSGVVFGLFGEFWILLLAAVFGVISPSGNEIGPFRAVEESTLAHLTPDEVLPDIFAWYSLLGTGGTALGIMTCGWAVHLLQELRGWEFIAACRVVFFMYAAIGGVKLVFTLGLSGDVEAVARQAPEEEQGVDETQPLLAEQSTSAVQAQHENPPKKSWFRISLDKDLIPLITKLFVLFALDSFASGLASMSWMTYFFRNKFSLPEGNLASIFFTTSIICSISMLVASSIAKRIGNVKTMVFTHLPSAIFLSLIPLPSTLPPSLTFLILRASTQSMDVAPRSAFLAIALPADKRTAIMGAVNVVKTASQSVAPFITGVLGAKGHLGVAFCVAGGLKGIYDLGMLVCFAGRDGKRTRVDDEEWRA
ncbi:putative MFS transporter [Aspergillus glaucus CBS 516.65]|uniref:Major facilitator superfamily (MFS) profile domain-containing protein n=1 Tax=Aspergillus glaucus CBS 516.65 TaxID=1160497 RepID=A0A1L9VN67_ASPGL|nr:hypothetical protein ASPGLDRAFT_146587 [Aspergillus glaucus CBS 516.65]OJJ85378.1 hypothetical protein ASPGLDRAFT_146587 [Aspergillus glaucus CBS 516.65]